LGIGTSSPSKGLHLNFSNDLAAIRFQNTANAKVWDLTPSIPGVANSGFSLHNVTDNTVPLHVDNSGNVGIGTSDPNLPLTVISNSGANAIEIRARSNDDYAFIQFYNHAGTALRGQIFNHNGAMAISTGTTGTARLEITSTGYVEMASASQVRLTLGSQGTAGTNSANWIRGNGTSLGYNSAGGNHAWEVSGTPRMNLTAAGHLILPTNAGYMQVTGPSSSAWAFGSTGGTNSPGTAATGMGWHRWNGSSWLSNMYLGPTGILGVFGSGTTSPRSDITMTTGTSDSSKRWGFGGGAGGNNAVFYVINESNVGVYLSHGAQAWVAHSDERIKENITGVGTVLPSLMNMRCVKYNLISNPADTKIGFIAQDWESAFPEVVDENEHLVLEADGTVGTDDDSDSTTPVKAMAYTETIPLLLKAIQELKEELNTATARITELENN